MCLFWLILRATLGNFGSEVILPWRGCFLFFHNARLGGRGSQPHCVVSIVTKRWSSWSLLPGVEIKPALNSIFGILALGAKEEHFGCQEPLVLTRKSKNNGMLLVVLGPWWWDEMVYSGTFKQPVATLSILSFTRGYSHVGCPRCIPC